MRQARDLVRPILDAAAEPLATTQIAELSGGWQVIVYKALCSLERDGAIVRTGRLGPSVRAEVLWRRADDPTVELCSVHPDRDVREVGHG